MSDDDNPALALVMERILAGRTVDLTCPFCDQGTLEAKASPYGRRFICPTCRRYLDAPEEA